MDISQVAWAGGLFEAEGSVSHHLPKGRHTPRATLDVSQKGEARVPEVLERFRTVVERGQIFGPYRGYLYYWRTHDVANIAWTIALLWPWLSPEKRSQMGRTLEAVPALWLARPSGELLTHRIGGTHPEAARSAWAAGFFEGDGTIGAYPNGRGSAKRVLTASIAQAAECGLPSVLTRFRDIAGEGRIYGPITPRGWSRLPQYRWQARGAAAARIATILLPWLVGPKREQVLSALEAAR